MRPSKISSSILAVTSILTASSLSASDNPGAHQHGHAELQLAIEGNQIDLTFTSPAYNLLGFEHRAPTEEQKALVIQTTNWLGETPLVDTAEASCTVMNAVVHHQAGGDDHKDESSHSDFEVTQRLTCLNIDATEIFSTPLMVRFSVIEALDVEWIWQGGQGSIRLRYGDTGFRLSAQ
jgi:hypothetical protein